MAAAMTVIGRRNASRDQRRQLDLRGADLRFFDLRRLNLAGADLSKAVLDGAKLQGADLRGIVGAIESAKDATFDETTTVDEKTKILLLMGGARNESADAVSNAKARRRYEERKEQERQQRTRVESGQVEMSQVEDEGDEQDDVEEDELVAEPEPAKRARKA